MPTDDDWDDDSAEIDPDAGIETIPCPNCRRQIYEDAVQCPDCGEYITRDTRSLSGFPTWIIVIGLAGVISVIACALLFG